MTSYSFCAFYQCLVCPQDVCVESGGSSDKAEEVDTDSTTHLTPELIDPNHVVPALKGFLEQLMRSRSVGITRHTYLHANKGGSMVANWTEHDIM